MGIAIESRSVLCKRHKRSNTVATLSFTHRQPEEGVYAKPTHTPRLATSIHTFSSQIPDVATYGAVMKSLDEALD